MLFILSWLYTAFKLIYHVSFERHWILTCKMGSIFNEKRKALFLQVHQWWGCAKNSLGLKLMIGDFVGLGIFLVDFFWDGKIMTRIINFLGSLCREEWIFGYILGHWTFNFGLQQIGLFAPPCHEQTWVSPTPPWCKFTPPPPPLVELTPPHPLGVAHSQSALAVIIETKFKYAVNDECI